MAKPRVRIEAALTIDVTVPTDGRVERLYTIRVHMNEPDKHLCTDLTPTEAGAFLADLSTLLAECPPDDDA